MVITSMNHIMLAVKDIDISFAFYRDVVGLYPLVKWDMGAYFLVGDKKAGFWFCLNVDEGRKPNTCYTHYAFSVNPEDFALMVARVLNSGTELFKDNTSYGRSLYFLDPDGHKLEIHASNCQERLQAKKADPGDWKNVEWLM